MAGMRQDPRDGPNHILLLKVIMKNERARRKGEKKLENPYWDTPIHEFLFGSVGRRIRSGNTTTDPGMD
jgi:hypothetical protein